MGGGGGGENGRRGKEMKNEGAGNINLKGGR